MRSLRQKASALSPQALFLDGSLTVRLFIAGRLNQIGRLFSVAACEVAQSLASIGAETGADASDQQHRHRSGCRRRRRRRLSMAELSMSPCSRLRLNKSNCADANTDVRHRLMPTLFTPPPSQDFAGLVEAKSFRLELILPAEWRYAGNRHMENTTSPPTRCTNPSPNYDRRQHSSPPAFQQLNHTCIGIAFNQSAIIGIAAHRPRMAALAAASPLAAGMQHRSQRSRLLLTLQEQRDSDLDMGAGRAIRE
ncbi:hypothetical protein SVAN01_04970 [Stagonosporopsis vannaccii]|nr:hypothetical protein SVAN01_04970 [Stagonosporopsis vannaccii]